MIHIINVELSMQNKGRIYYNFLFIVEKNK
jgi:hypothetical protein